MTVIFLLVVIAILLYTRRPHRDYSLSVALLIAAFTWLALEIHPLRLLRGLFALAVEHWADTVTAFSGVVLLIVPAAMIYIALRDQIASRALTGARNTVLNKFERRVDTLMALGYGRTEAEANAFHQMKRDLNNYPAARRASKHHA